MYKFEADDAVRFASEQGIKAIRRGNELRLIRCPYCKNKTDDRNTFAISLETGQFNCLRATCGAHGNMITLARDFGFSLGADADEYFNPRKRYRDLRKYPRPKTREPAVEFLEGRGISREVAERYAITSQKDHDNIIAFPFFDENGDMQFVKYRKADFDKDRDKNKEWCEANCRPILFGMDQCDPEAGPLVLTEGQIDSLSVAEAGIPNAVSVPTGAKGFTWVPYCWEFLRKFEELIVFGDYEGGKITLLDEMAKRFGETVKHVRPDDYRDCKDANDLLRKYGKRAVIDAVEQAEPIKNKLILDASEIDWKRPVDEVIDTGIKQLNKLIGGFPLGRLVVVTGGTGKGKSTLATQFVVAAAEQGYRSFIYSGELASWEVERSLARQIAGPACIRKIETPLGFCDYEVGTRYEEAVRGWQKNKLYLYDNAAANLDENSELIGTVENAIRQYGCRVILLDNLMSAMVDNMQQDLYRQQTRFVNRLHLIASTMDVLIILVAHLRKNGDKDDGGNDEIAGSSNITNLADVTLKYSDPKPRTRKENGKNVEYIDRERDGDRVLRVMKNRIAGELGTGSIKLWYDRASTRIAEAKGLFDWELSWRSGTNEFVPVDETDEVIPF